jgi:hypothetical protein
VHKVVDTFGYLLSLVVTAGNVDDRKPLDELCQKVQEVTGNKVLYMFADDDYRGEKAEDYIIELVMVKRPSGTRLYIVTKKMGD